MENKKRGTGFVQRGIDLPSEVTADSIGIAELERHHCRWPVHGSPGEDYLFCGAGRVEPSPYCAQHLGRAAAGPSPKRISAARLLSSYARTR